MGEQNSTAEPEKLSREDEAAELRQLGTECLALGGRLAGMTDAEAAPVMAAIQAIGPSLDTIAPVISRLAYRPEEASASDWQRLEEARARSVVGTTLCCMFMSYYENWLAEDRATAGSRAAARGIQLILEIALDAVKDALPPTNGEHFAQVQAACKRVLTTCRRVSKG
jgi:hypothetical protein